MQEEIYIRLEFNDMPGHQGIYRKFPSNEYDSLAGGLGQLHPTPPLEANGDSFYNLQQQHNSKVYFYFTEKFLDIPEAKELIDKIRKFKYIRTLIRKESELNIIWKGKSGLQIAVKHDD